MTFLTTDVLFWSFDFAGHCVSAGKRQIPQETETPRLKVAWPSTVLQVRVSKITLKAVENKRHLFQYDEQFQLEGYRRGQFVAMLPGWESRIQWLKSFRSTGRVALSKLCRM